MVRTAYEQLGGWSCGLPSLAGDSWGLFWLWDVHCVAWAMAPAAVALCAGCARGVCVCVCVFVCVCGVSEGGLSRCQAEEPPLRPDLVLVRWRPPRQLLLLSPGLRCGRLHFLPLASAGRRLRQGLPSGEPAELAPSRPCHGRCHGGGASCCGVSVVGLYWAR